MQLDTVQCSYLVVNFIKSTLYAVICSQMRVWNSIGNRVYVNSVTRVQIPSSLPEPLYMVCVSEHNQDTGVLLFDKVATQIQ